MLLSRRHFVAQPAGLRRAGARGEGRIHRVDVDRQVGARSALAGVRDRLGQHRSQAELVDLGHRVPAEALLPHGVELLGGRPGATQADLDDVAAEQDALHDRSRERLPVVGQRAVLVDLARVGVRVEVDDAESLWAVVGGERAQDRQRDRVIAADHGGDRTRSQDLADARLDRRMSGQDVARGRIGVAVVDDRELLVGIDAELDAGPAVDAGILGLADGTRTEARARAIRHGQVEGRAEHGHVNAREIFGRERDGPAGERQRDAGEAAVGVARGLDRRHARIMPVSVLSTTGSDPVLCTTVLWRQAVAAASRSSASALSASLSILPALERGSSSRISMRCGTM